MEGETKEQKYKDAKERVGNLKAFYTNLISYLVINLILVIINYVTSPGHWWFYWVTIFWGIAVLLHGMSVFSKNKLGKKWEEKKIDEEMKKD